MATTGGGGTSGGGGAAGGGGSSGSVDGAVGSGGTTGTGGQGSVGAGRAGSSGSSGSGTVSGRISVYMAIDRGGEQHRSLLFTDSRSIYCAVLFPPGTQDVTIDYTIIELEGPGGAAPPFHTFAAGRETVRPSTNTPVVFLVPPNGSQDTTCTGHCVKNGAGCPLDYISQGENSAGPGGTCCYKPTGQPASCLGAVPYPVGTFQCVVQVDGVTQAEEPTFQIEEPPK